ncbi:MAG TPA: glycosyltransferase [Stellaceae bacterium]|nr:glycosyltransferase [Stellaceae bacterium]
MIRSIAVVVPVLDDWASFATLVADLARQFAASGLALRLYAIDDGSLAPFAPAALNLPPGCCIVSLDIIRLALNLGHQRAIAVGLCVVADSPLCEAAVVMDGDGEDRPSDIAMLLAASRDDPGAIVLARRARRSEPWTFRVWYHLYRALFHVLTGHAIRFGNFSLLPITAVRRLVYMPELWNHLAAAIMRSRLPYREVAIARGRRFAGRSHMNLIGLIVHGLSALSVHTDMIFVRVLLGAAAIGVAAALGIVAVAGIRFGTNLAIPGWATIAAGDLLIVLVQTLVVVVAATLTMLAGRSNRPIVPILDARQFIAERQTFDGDRLSRAATP